MLITQLPGRLLGSFRTILALHVVLRVFSTVQALNSTGQKTNSEYKIPDYYGSRDKEFYYVGTIISDSLTVVRWSERIDYHEVLGTYFLAVPDESVVKSFKPNATGSNTGSFKRVAGIPFTEVNRC